MTAALAVFLKVFIGLQLLCALEAWVRKEVRNVHDHRCG